MASKYWIKLYHEILDDPKMGRLSDRLFRRCIQLFLIAGEEDSNGLLPRPDDMAWRLRPLSTEELENDLDELAKVGIVSKTDNGWIVVHFAERQKAVGGAERVRRFRDRQKADEYYGAKDETEKPKSNADVTIYNEESNATVTKRYTDKDIDKELESTPNGVGDKSPETPPDSKPKTKIYQKADPKPDGPLKQLMGIFQAETGLKMPHKKSDIKFWWSNIGEIYEIADRDVDIGQRLIKQSAQALKDKTLTIGGPESIIKTCRALAAGQPIGDRQNGHHKNTATNQTSISGLREKGSDNPVKKRFNPTTGETYWVDIRTNQRVPAPDSA